MLKLTRRQYFINKKLQTKYIVLTITLLLAYTLFFISLLLAPYIFSLIFDNPLNEQAQAARILLNLHNTIWPALGFGILGMSFMTIFITHRVAGPVYRLKKVLSEIANGNLDIRFNLRKKDDLKDLAEDMEIVVNDLRAVISSLEEGHSSVSACINEIEEKVRKNQIESDAGKELTGRLLSYREKVSLVLKKYRREHD